MKPNRITRALRQALSILFTAVLLCASFPLYAVDSTAYATDVPSVDSGTPAAAEADFSALSIRDAIAASGYAYVLTDDHEAGLYNGSGMNSDQRFGTLNGRGQLLFATEVVDRGDLNGAVHVWFYADGNAVDGYLSEARLGDVPMNAPQAEAYATIQGISVVPWQFGEQALFLATAPFTAGVEAAPTQTPEPEPTAETTPRPTEVRYQATVKLNADPTIRLSQNKSQDSEINGYADNGAVVSVLSEEDEWRWVRTEDGLEGYVRAQYLTTGLESPATATDEGNLENVTDANLVTTVPNAAAEPTAAPAETAQPDEPAKPQDAVETAAPTANADAFTIEPDLDMTDAVPTADATPAVYGETGTEPAVDGQGNSVSNLGTAAVSAPAGQATLYAEPSDTSESVLTLANGAAVEVLSVEGVWAFVYAFDDVRKVTVQGYVETAYLLMASQSGAVPVTSEIVEPALLGAADELPLGADAGGMEPAADDLEPLVGLSLSAANGVTGFLTGQEAVVNMTIDMSSMTTTLSDVTAKITFPSTYIQNFGGVTVRAGDLSIATESIVWDSPSVGFVTVNYHFDTLAGGTTLLVPVNIPTQIGYTPDNYVLPVNATLVDNTGAVLKTANTQNFTFQVRDRAITKLMNGTISANNVAVYAGPADTTNTSLVASDTTVPVTFTYTCDWYNYYNNALQWVDNRGRRTDSQHIIVDTLPVGAVFNPSLNPGWTYNSVANTATYAFDLSFLPSGSPVNNTPTLKLLLSV